MLRSNFCILDGLAESDVLDLNECPYDKVRGSWSLDLSHELMTWLAGWLFCHQRIREGLDRARTHGGQPRLRVRKVTAFTNYFPRRDPISSGERWQNDLVNADQDDATNGEVGASR